MDDLEKPLLRPQAPGAAHPGGLASGLPADARSRLRPDDGGPESLRAVCGCLVCAGIGVLIVAAGVLALVVGG